MSFAQHLQLQSEQYLFQINSTRKQTNAEKKEQQQTPPAFQRWFSVGSFFGR
jgi:hypothetical protein